MSTNEVYYATLKANLPSEVSYKTYVSSLNSLLRRLSVESINEILMKPTKYIPKINAEYENIGTRINVYKIMLSLYTHTPDLKEQNKSKWQKWWDGFVTLNDFMKEKAKENKPTLKQDDKYVSFEDIELKHHELKSSADPHDTKKKSQQYLLLSLILEITPKRSDFGSVRIYKDNEPTAGSSASKSNFIVIKSKGSLDNSYLVMNKYKTAKTYKRYEEDLSSKFVNVLKQSMRRYPRPYLFVDTQGNPYNNNGYGHFFSRNFGDLFGKDGGVSLLRHSYISERLSNGKSDKELEEIAHLMGHSLDQQRSYRFVTKVNPLRKCECDIKNS